MAEKLPEDLSRVLVNASLYSEFIVETDEELDSFYEYLYRETTFDCYCISCKKETTFKLEAHKGSYLFVSSDRRIAFEQQLSFSRTGRCSRKEGHFIMFIFQYHANRIYKIGQYPSVADISIADTKKYHKIIGKESLKEFNKAIGLFSHGVGIGSFVYLRRIFENLIDDAHREAIVKIPSWDEEAYTISNVGKRIDLLSDLLPPFLSQNKGIYSILSKGIHELSEEECLDMFPFMKICIEIILDERIQQLEKQNKTEMAVKAVQSFLQKLKA